MRVLLLADGARSAIVQAYYDSLYELFIAEWMVTPPPPNPARFRSLTAHSSSRPSPSENPKTRLPPPPPFARHKTKFSPHQVEFVKADCEDSTR